MTDELLREGGCRCGAVRFRASGRPLWEAHCHCRSCRRATGAAMATYAGYATAQVAFSGAPHAWFETSPGARRSFCGRCGSPLAFVGDRWPGEIHLHAAAFDDPAALKPQAHVYWAERLPWLQVSDGLPRFATTSSEGGPLP